MTVTAALWDRFATISAVRSQRIGSFVDLAYTVVVFVAATSYFYRVNERPDLDAGLRRIESVRGLHAAEVEGARRRTAEIEAEIRAVVSARDAAERRGKEIQKDFRRKIASVATSEARAREEGAPAERLRERLDSQLAQLAGTEAQTHALDARALDLDAQRVSGRDSLRAIDSRRGSLTRRLARLESRDRAVGPALLSGSTGVAAFLQSGGERNYLAFSLNRDVVRIADWDFGVSGSFGVGNASEVSLRDLGFYGSRRLVPGFASMDFGLGVERRRLSAGDASSDFYGSVLLRLAPLAREHAFFLVGLKAARDEAQSLFGIGFGRR
jgi:hypothetical protein